MSLTQFEAISDFQGFLDTKYILKLSLSIKILSINNFTTKVLSKLLSDLYTGVHLKGTKKFVSKVSNRNFFIERLFFIWKHCLLLTLLIIFLVSKSAL